MPPISCRQSQPLRPFKIYKEKVVVVMGATGTGKSKLAIDLAIHFKAEVVNSDKMQVYDGLDVVTNKVSEAERAGVHHHLLGGVPGDAEFTAADFCYGALRAVESIIARGKLPIIAGGSNSYIEELVEKELQLSYDCCFIWVDVELPVLYAFVAERVDEMVERGLVEEVRGVFDAQSDDVDYSRGIRRAIGVPEMDGYLRAQAAGVEGAALERILAAAVEEIKANTCKLACRQLQKIHRLRARWGVHRIDATGALVQRGAGRAWGELVAGPSTDVVWRFLYGGGGGGDGAVHGGGAGALAAAKLISAVGAAV